MAVESVVSMCDDQWQRFCQDYAEICNLDRERNERRSRFVKECIRHMKSACDKHIMEAVEAAVDLHMATELDELAFEFERCKSRVHGILFYGRNSSSSLFDTKLAHINCLVAKWRQAGTQLCDSLYSDLLRGWTDLPQEARNGWVAQNLGDFLAERNRIKNTCQMLLLSPRQSLLYAVKNESMVTQPIAQELLTRKMADPVAVDLIQEAILAFVKHFVGKFELPLMQVCEAWKNDFYFCLRLASYDQANVLPHLIETATKDCSWHDGMLRLTYIHQAFPDKVSHERLMEVLKEGVFDVEGLLERVLAEYATWRGSLSAGGRLVIRAGGPAEKPNEKAREDKQS